MARRVALVVVGLLALAGTAWAQGRESDPSGRKASLDARLAELRGDLAASDRRQSVLTSDISAVTSRMRSLQGDIDRAASHLDGLESELGAYRSRLAKLTELFALQSRKVGLLRRQQAIAEARLAERLVDIYEARPPTTVEVVLSAATLDELVDTLDYVNHIGRQDRRIARQVMEAKEEVRAARVRTGRTREGVRRTTIAIGERVARQRAVQARLLAARGALAGARADERRMLAASERKERGLRGQVEDLSQESAALAAAIAAAQARASTPPASRGGGVQSGGAASPGGLIWPVTGPITSPFGPRWGRLHLGIDIAAPGGTPLRAAAAGTVITAGWMGGYGNLVVLDHGGGLATAYAHQSAVAVGAGQRVVQGETVGYVGCTGTCTGDHVHFEVRVNGAPVDPLGYL